MSSKIYTILYILTLLLPITYIHLLIRGTTSRADPKGRAARIVPCVVEGDIMSKNQKKTIEVPVETVENWEKMCEYCSTTIRFWKLDNNWPTNLIYDGLTDMLSEIRYFTPTRSTFDDIPF